MNFFGFHICMDEVKAIAQYIPFIGVLWLAIQSKWHHYKKHKDCKDK